MECSNKESTTIANLVHLLYTQVAHLSLILLQVQKGVLSGQVG